MQLETALDRLGTLVEQLSDTATTSTDLSEAWKEIDELLNTVIAPAIKSGGSLPLDEIKKDTVRNLISELAILEQKLQIKVRALDTFAPHKNIGDQV